MVLVLHVDESQLLPLVLAHEVDQLTTLFDLVETLDELVGECVDPFGEIILDFNESLTYALLPVLDDVNGWVVLDDGLACVLFDCFELFKLLLVLLVNVVQVFLGDDTLEALVHLLDLGVEGGGSIVHLAINSEC